MVLTLPGLLWTGYPVSEYRPFTPYWTGIGTGCKTLRKSREVSLGEDLMGWGRADRSRPCQLAPTCTAHSCLCCPSRPCSAPREGDPQALQHWGSDWRPPTSWRPTNGTSQKKNGRQGKREVEIFTSPTTLPFCHSSVRGHICLGW